MLSDQDLAALLEAGSKAALDCGCGCPGEPGVMPGCGCTTCVARRALAALAPVLAQELIRLREALQEVMEDHAWRDELWRFTDETEATLAALAPAPSPAGERQGG